ncbi:MAG: ABC transporter permease, partial [Chlorobia bacterium]|nr:ABC transporter permease [Fimbriimonadaceae bacterium]
MLDRIQFLLGEGFLSLRRNGWMTFAAISTVAVALFLIGGLAYLHGLMKSYAGQMTGVIDIRAIVIDGTQTSELSRIAKDIRSISGVKAAFLIPKDKAWRKFLDENPEHKQYAELENPYPDSFKITLTDLKVAENVASEVASVKGVSGKDIKYLKEVSNFLAQAQSIVSWLGFAVGGLLFITAGILIYNAIRLTVISRRLEIRIMQLVGASFLTVRVPFYIEGIVQGLIGGGVAVFI